MGVPRLFRFLSQRYPCLVDEVTNDQCMDFDNLYLDMNGIIHQCAHSNNKNLSVLFNEETVFKDIFHYVEVLFNFVKPRKLLFLAVDGVAPQAKMNNQRARRFMKAKEYEKQNNKWISQGKIPVTVGFDSNCISPGTEFMHLLHSQLKYFVTSKLSTDPMWQRCKVILSGHQTPGEGEHKIMDYIRYMRTQPDYNPNLRHCVFGSDADLMMLVLSTHECNFFIIREKADNHKKSEHITSVDEIEFQLINVPFLRDYLDLEFEELKEKLPFQYDLDHIVDDWILMTFLLGNDFVPNLPDLYIKDKALPILYKTYKEVLPTLEGYLNENGHLNLSRFQGFMAKLADYDMETFEENYADLVYLEGKLGRKLIPEMEDGDLETTNSSGKKDLEALVKLTEEMFQFSDEELFEDDHDTFLLEFCQKKKNYYSNKLGLGEVTEEILKSQAEGYIRAIQWILHYYFHGCRSWNWFYPHHYSPYISDIVDFKDCSLEFELGQPLLPFEQLMAILPAASKSCLPEIYHDLMTSPDSPIIDFYPSDFEIDLQKNQYQWEAVILIPFIDQARLKEAMEPLAKLLSKEETERNRHDDMHVYTYTEQNLGTYKSAGYFPDLAVNHALQTNVPKAAFLVEKSKLKFGMLGDLTNLKCATLKHVPHTGSLRDIKVSVFAMPSREESLVLSLIKQDDIPPLKELGETLLGKIVHVNWPNLIESMVVSVSDSETKLTITSENAFKEEPFDQNMTNFWKETCKSLTETYLKKRGIDVGEIEVIVYVKHLEGRKYSFGKRGTSTVQKIWSSKISAWPLQTVVRNHTKEIDFRAYKSIEEAFPVGSTVFILEKLHFGLMGKVLDSSECIKGGRLNVAMEVVKDIRADQLSKFAQKPSFMSNKTIATRMGISCRLLNRLTGHIFVITGKCDDSEEVNNAKVNIGLKMKYQMKNEELPGYTTKENDYWVYSEKAANVIFQYMEKFPEVIEYLSENLDASDYHKEEMFPGAEGDQKLQALVQWIEDQEHLKTKTVPCGSEVLERDVVLSLDKTISEHKKSVTVKKVQISSCYLYKSDLYLGNASPVPSSRHCLLDRVVSIRSSYTVPVGLRGTIIGIQKSTKSSGIVYSVLFDEPFIGGLKLYVSENKVFKMTEAFFLNLTDSNRTLPKRVTPVVENKAQRLFSNEMQRFAPSAFAQVNHAKEKVKAFHPEKTTARSSSQSKNLENDEFRKLWSNLQNEKPQEETMVLKRLLKIGNETSNEPEKQSEQNQDKGRQRQQQQQEPKQEKDKVVDAVKSFFKNITLVTQDGKKLPENRVPGKPYYPGPSSVPPFFPQPVPLPSFTNPSACYFFRLCAHFKSRNMQSPKYNVFRLNDKFVAQVTCSDGRIFSSVALESERAAIECASRNALISLGESFNETEESVARNQSIILKDRRMMENQKRLTEAIAVAPEHQVVLRPDRPKNNFEPFHPAIIPHGNAANFSHKVTPKKLPYPPQRWVAGTFKRPSAKYGFVNQEHKEPFHKGNWTHEQRPRNAIQEEVKIKGEGQKTRESALGFVPLQALTGKRNVKTIATTQPVSLTNNANESNALTQIMRSSNAHVHGPREESKGKVGPPNKPRPRIAANLNLDPNLY